MDKKIALKWAKALESGEYKQTQDYLSHRPSPKKDFGYCCLGVLCDLYSKETGEGKWISDGCDRNFFTGIKTDGGDDELAGTDLPRTVQRWAGMLTPFGQYGNVETLNLAHLNDTGTDFKTIAKAIRKHYKDL